ncbi:MAG: diguanylate cyclase [Methylococcaceae bacterium]|nr:diguanylate cyclase [Methylococcaceae bacterium]
MAPRLCLLCCENFRLEIEAAVAAEGWPDIAVASFPAHCGHPAMEWDLLSPLVAEGCTEVWILGRACLRELENPPEGWPTTRVLPQTECFHLVAGPALVAEAIARGAYLMTPGWLDDWPGNLRKLGFSQSNAAEFFQDFARELLLLDTGVAADAGRKLAELAAAVRLPASQLAVGIDYTRLLLARRVAEWRQKEAEERAQECEQRHARERADHLAAMDFLGKLAELKDETETVAAIKEMFQMLFAPQTLHYLRYENGTAQVTAMLPQDLREQTCALDRDWGWTNSGTGFLLRIAWSGETLGIVAADHFMFPEFRERYLNLARSVAGPCGLAIQNARTFQRVKAAEEALRKSEFTLKMAQAIAHVGHWEWNLSSDSMRWSDETYRILGYAPQELAPNRGALLQVIHPDDRACVANHIDQAAREEGGFELEFRIVLPDGGVRAVHGMGEVILAGTGQQPEMIGALNDITEREMIELLGVIQDITDRKELERKLAQEAHTDALTGCANRRYFLRLARQEWARVRRYGYQLSVLLLDLDHFKTLNDRYGHQVGDLALQKFVQVCQTSLREGDLIGRLGGEEFAVLLPEAGTDEALEAAERLRHAIDVTEVTVASQPPLRFTTSIGIATRQADDTDVEELLSRADRAMYRAKNAGRNRVLAA